MMQSMRNKNSPIGNRLRPCECKIQEVVFELFATLSSVVKRMQRLVIQSIKNLIITGRLTAS